MSTRRQIPKRGSLKSSFTPPANPLKTRGFGKGIQARSAQLPQANPLQTRPFGSPIPASAQQEETESASEPLEIESRFGYNGLDVPVNPPEPPPVQRKGEGQGNWSQPLIQRANPVLNGLNRIKAQRFGQDQTREPILHDVIQRDLTEDQKQSWKDKKGDQLVSQIKASVEEWKKFRGKPEAFEQLPEAGKAPSQLAELLNFAPEYQYIQYAAEQLGSDNIIYLSEMAAFISGVSSLIGLIPGLAYIEPDHKYKMTANQDSLWNSIPFIPINGIKIEYSNAFGWYWQKELTGSQLQWSVGIGYEKGKGISGGGAADSPWDSKGKPKSGLKKPLVPSPATISINTEATATSVGYWGYKDLAGFLKIANGPSIKGSFHGFGGKVVTGGIISIEGSGGGPPGPLDFMDVVSKIEVKPATPAKAKELKQNLEISLTLVEEGFGVLVGGSEQVAIPELEPTPVPEEKIWRYVVSGFETGREDLDIPEGEVHPTIEMIRKDIDDKKKNVESITPYLKQTGIKQEFKLDFHMEGYASRLWTGAYNNDNLRQQKNLELSTRRAQNVTAMLYAAFGSEHTYSFEGKGSSVALPDQPNESFDQVLPETNNEQIIDQMIRKEIETYKKQFPNMSPDEIRKIVSNRFGKISDTDWTRRVNITVIWRGYNIKWGANASPIPHDPNQL